MTKKRTQQLASKAAMKAMNSRPKQRVVPKKEGKTKSGLNSGISRFPDQGKPEAVAAAYSTGKRTRQPKIIRSDDRVRIIHEELIASVVGTDAYTLAFSFALNPGLNGTFPWLSTQAQGWERYRFRRLRFCYYTRTGSNVPGSVMMVPDYDAADTYPVSEQIASVYKDVAEDAPWKDICCDLPESRLNAIGPSRYIRTGALSANLDVKTYDAGNLFVLTMDGTAVKWGKIWVQYDVELITPQLNAAGGGVIATQAISGAVPTSASLLGTQTLVTGSANLVSVAGEVVTFIEGGSFILIYECSSTTSCTQTAAPTVAAGGTRIGRFLAGDGTTNFCQSQQVNAVVGTTVTFDNTIVSGLTANLIVSKIPSNLGNAENIAG